MTKDTDPKTGPVKTCTKCGESKGVEDFRFSASMARPRTECRDCERKACNEHRARDTIAARKREAESRERNRDTRLEYSRKYLEENRERERIRSTEYNEANREERRKYARDRARIMREEDPDYGKKKYAQNRERELERARERRCKVRNRIHYAMSRAIAHCLGAGGKSGESWLKIVGYSREDLMRHLERQFLPGMTWENYGADGWEIDHIVPKSLYVFTDKNDIEFKKCWSLKNLQPLWRFDNRSKRDRIPLDAPRDLLPMAM